MKIYAININRGISPKLFTTLLSFVSKERREKINKFIRKEDANRSLVAAILIRVAINENLHIKNRDIFFYYNAYGKPYLKYTPPLYFNLSHSGNWVVCAIDDYHIGIDVEQMKNIDFHIAKSFFAEKEYNDLMKKDGAEKKSYFYDLWTLKESYIKACGKGLSLDLSSFYIGIAKNNIILQTKNEFNKCSFRQYTIEENYKMSVCASEDNFPEQVTFKTLEDLHIDN
ncbi:4'-phosphopantetheinyl transferase family protein [Clostridium akagii]|uniref:4'-phosphopantetheinyl transferase family protein n=1 Tax=Clostridium akagii TaxID=91623 RepID=UPI00047ECE67|nr:4'-phosphopantetheinyl transferase superfamily protein [Clostridium akagii]